VDFGLLTRERLMQPVAKQDFRVTEVELHELARRAWEAREYSHVIGPTKVGCAVICDDGRIFTGCNVEHPFRSHDVHAEVNAITTMVAGGGRFLRAVVIVADREQFTPCGACMDWIMEFIEHDCTVAFQSQPRGPFVKYTARQLMPFYPK
jgi:cytidine deaminase